MYRVEPFMSCSFVEEGELKAHLMMSFPTT